jgi:GNAT superfamily N-acetyltransferase
MTQTDVIVERLTEYSEVDAAGIGRLMPFLSERLSGNPVDEALLRAIISSPYHEQLVARLNGTIVGVATMNLLMGPGANREGYLEDFVTDPDVRGQGIGGKVWNSMIEWCLEYGVDFSFTSRATRDAAHSFYLNHGAEIRDTTAFHVSVNKDV